MSLSRGMLVSNKGNVTTLDPDGVILIAAWKVFELVV
jgi:hypothetical protein